MQFPHLPVDDSVHILASKVNEILESGPAGGAEDLFLTRECMSNDALSEVMQSVTGLSDDEGPKLSSHSNQTSVLGTPDSGYQSIKELPYGETPTACDGPQGSNGDGLEQRSLDCDIRDTDDSPRIFALVVGVDKYLSPQVPGLSGCVNDALDFISFLEHDLAVPKQRIQTLCDEAATCAAIISMFKDHFWNNPHIQKGDALIFFFAGHGTFAQAPADWAAERNQVELLCPYDFHRHGDVAYGIHDYTLYNLMRTLASLKGDNITAILDCCHSGGMDREITIEFEEGVRRIPSTLECTIPNHAPPERMVSFEQPRGIAYKAMASHVTLAACRSTEKAREERCGDGYSKGVVRGVFTANLLSMLRSIGKKGLEALSYSRLMNELPRHKGRSFSDLSSLIDFDQHPQCEGTHKNRMLFSMRLLPDSPDAFLLVKVGRTWHVQAGTVQGVTVGTRFGVPRDAGRTGAQTMEAILIATSVGPTTCVVECHHELPDDLNQRTVVVTDWRCADALVTSVYVPDTCQLARRPCPPRLSSAGFLYQVTHDPRIRADLVLNDVPGSSSGLHIERFDPLVKRFGGVSCVLAAVEPAPGTGISDLLDAVARFNSHLYRFNSDTMIDKEIRVSVELHAVEEIAGTVSNLLEPSGCFRRLPGRDSDILLRGVEALLGHSCSSDTDFDSDDAEGQTGIELRANSSLLATPSHHVHHAQITELDNQYGFTLVNNSKVPLFPYVFYFDPGTYEIKTLYAPEWRTCDPPLPVGGRLPVGYDGLGFLKVFVSTCYIDLNIEQASPLASNSREMREPPVRTGPHMVRLPLYDNWNAWVYVLAPSP
ncbi:hypothetical protein DAEQUDRAFT_768994 [Daedalea quercina L-15889]|uniref:Peptidase C14 caspase domain-containing protein n=1 Tax=Daedalea quercina L-15889 TaxID=1314783 RepID=A0A165M4Q8_9APHY|nr:hypothetical protein DAEQUDRAFT_768994 [Daedalea quercina L-15889]